MEKPYAAGIAGSARIFFVPFLLAFEGIEVRHVEKECSYRAYLFDPITGEDHDYGSIVPDEQGSWKTGPLKVFQDWVLVLEKGGSD